MVFETLNSKSQVNNAYYGVYDFRTQVNMSPYLGNYAISNPVHNRDESTMHPISDKLSVQSTKTTFKNEQGCPELRGFATMPDQLDTKSHII